MSAPTLDAEPACPGTVTQNAEPAEGPRGLQWRAEHRPFAEIPQATWDALAARNPWATPFSSWAFHRAWWDAYGDNAHDETLVIVPAAPAHGAEPLAIFPLMHRHAVEPTDAATHTTMRHGHHAELTPIRPDATVLFFGASYHADYATVLASPADIPAVGEAFAAYLAGRPWSEWDVVDLRRLRCGDSTADAFAAALGAYEMAEGWTLNVEREDVCPVVTLPANATMDDYLATLGKKERHEIRRKVRRAEAVGVITLVDSTDPLVDLDAFIDFHQRRWGDDGLFPDTVGGRQSRVFFRRLFELLGPDGPLRLTFLCVGARRIAAGVHLETPEGYLYYNAGVDPDARELSPGVLMVHAYVQRAIDAGVRRLDFLRGDEPYKYEWGAVDEAIQRLLLRRRVT